MALADIQQHIKDKAAEEVAKIQAKSSEDLKAHEAEWQERLKAEQERLRTEINRSAEAKLAQAKFVIGERAGTEVLKAKQAQLDTVYNEVKEELRGMNSAEYTKVITDLLKDLKDLDGEVVTSKERSGEITEALKKAGAKAKVSKETIDTVGGFIFRSAEVDLDSTFEAILARVKEDTVIPVHKILFD